MRSFFAMLLAAGLMGSAVAGVVGMFQGRIVQPAGMKVEDGVLFIRARNGMARKVRVEKAVVEYAEDVPKSQRGKAAGKSLCEDTLVRVTAEQTDTEDGAWKAINILILADPEKDAKAGRLKQVSLQAKPESQARPESQAKPGKESGAGKSLSGNTGKAEGLGFCVP